MRQSFGTKRPETQQVGSRLPPWVVSHASDARASFGERPERTGLDAHPVALPGRGHLHRALRAEHQPRRDVHPEPHAAASRHGGPLRAAAQVRRAAAARRRPGDLDQGVRRLEAHPSPWDGATLHRARRREHRDARADPRVQEPPYKGLLSPGTARPAAFEATERSPDRGRGQPRDATHRDGGGPRAPACPRPRGEPLEGRAPSRGAHQARRARG